MSQVPRVQTSITPTAYAAAFVRAWRALYDGADPTKEQTGVLWSQWQLETGGSACWNFNIGNEKITPGQIATGVPWFDLSGTWEIINGVKVVLPEGDPGRRFRSFDSLAEAMTEHLAFLRSKRYAVSWPFVVSGDPDGFARAIGKQGYYTAPIDAYARLLVSLFERWMKAPFFDEALSEVELEDDPIAETEPQPIVHPDVDEPDPTT